MEASPHGCPPASGSDTTPESQQWDDAGSMRLRKHSLCFILGLHARWGLAFLDLCVCFRLYSVAVVHASVWESSVLALFPLMLCKTEDCRASLPNQEAVWKCMDYFQWPGSVLLYWNPRNTQSHPRAAPPPGPNHWLKESKVCILAATTSHLRPGAVGCTFLDSCQGFLK
jgi:hypothetical protein